MNNGKRFVVLSWHGEANTQPQNFPTLLNEMKNSIHLARAGGRGESLCWFASLAIFNSGELDALRIAVHEPKKVS